LPNRSLSYLKIVQGELGGKSKAQDLLLTLPNRSLSYLKIVQGE